MKNALTGVERALFWTLVFAAFAAAAAGLAARAVDRLAVNQIQSLTNYAVVRVVAPEDERTATLAEATLAGSAHVARATLASPERTAQMIGGSVPPDDLPAVHLIELDLLPSAPRDIGAELEAALAQIGVTAEAVTAPPEVTAMPSRIRAAAFWGAVAFALVMALIISLAARGLAARRRELVTVMADCGATEGQAAGRIADEAAVLGLYAGLVGGLLAGAAGLVVLLIAIPGAGADTLPNMILPIDLAPIVAAPLGAAIAAGAGARAAAGFFHGQAARLG
jgi:cell division transport system permease protein